MNIQRFDEIDSTNEYLKTHPDCDIAVAKRQTAGRGRMGRHFESEEGGLYFSFRANPEQYGLATILAGISVAEALEKHYNISVEIKWVNDILVNGKKVCGILAESNLPNDLIIGVGINIHNRLSEAIRPIADCLENVCSFEANPEDIIAATVKRYYQLLSFDSNTVIGIYKKYISYFGKEILVFENGSQRTVTALDIADNGNLIVRERNGAISKLSSAEISTKIEKRV